MRGSRLASSIMENVTLCDACICDTNSSTTWLDIYTAIVVTILPFIISALQICMEGSCRLSLFRDFFTWTHEEKGDALDYQGDAKPGNVQGGGPVRRWASTQEMGDVQGYSPSTVHIHMHTAPSTLRQVSPDTTETNTEDVISSLHHSY